MNDPNVTYLPFLPAVRVVLPAVRVLLEFAIPMFAVSWLGGKLAFAVPLFTEVGENLWRPAEYRHKKRAEGESANRRRDARNGAIGVIFLCHCVWIPYALVFAGVRLPHYVPRGQPGTTPSGAAFLAIAAGMAIYFAASRFLLAQLARKLSPQDFAAMRREWKAMSARWDG